MAPFITTFDATYDHKIVEVVDNIFSWFVVKNKPWFYHGNSMHRLVFQYLFQYRCVLQSFICAYAAPQHLLRSQDEVTRKDPF